MGNARAMGRVGLLALGLGVGAAIASTPGVASADTSTDWLSLLLGPDAAASATTTPSLFDFAYSINGVSHDFGTATATSTVGSEAFAMGNDASANAGIVGSGSTDDFAMADGAYALADSGGNVSSNSGSAIDIGNNVAPSTYPGAPDGAYSGAATLIGNNAADAGNSGAPSPAPAA
ncbi:hypothetical protein [Candidatus Mycobacterium methanotrophicum]|uniref:Uncharacterized protein n=1 Tax=Candidatus Mycobacterium methanotrophicum TaxID=2943498 RepID=A0ABY4QLQ7_9MYCO|nr:hypothetical protein [Candidatus Mycobacterium methanotrophicum]UQX11804.1 hypothetical protein M5I08_05100 [Candidatus Mycobacterium methanotrophicum]